MSTTSPSTPESTPHRKMAMNRSFTLPAKMATTSRANPTAEIGATEGVETLYIHPNGKIVKFTCASSSRPGSSYGAGRSDQQGTLPWATLTEQTLAAGPLQIYRVPGSVSFLHSGSLLHAIMPRSNCWCVDGVSKFAMRVLADTYYRIELPGDSPEDLEKVEEFKETLKKVLFYERTACPFARTFTVELPEEPEVRKKRRKSHGPAKKWTLEKAYSWKPEDGGEPPSQESDESASATGSDEEPGAPQDDETQSGASEVADQVKEMRISTPTRPSVRERAAGLNMRSVTAPPQMALQATPPSRLRTTFVAEAEEEQYRLPSGHTDREPGTLQNTALRPFQAIPTDMPPSPPDSSAGFDYTEQTTRPTLPEQEANAQEQPGKQPSVVVPAIAPSIAAVDGVAPGEHAARSADEWEEKPRISDAELRNEADAGLNARGTHSDALFVNTASDVPQSESQTATADSSRQDASGPASAMAKERLPASLPDPDTEQNDTASEPKPDACEDPDAAVTSAVEPEPVDPFAQIQARIQARRSIGGTTSFIPSTKSPTRQSSVSTASSSSLSTRSSASHRSRATAQQQALATALVKKACSVFLGPPAQLVMIMLRIAARFAKGAFPSSLLFESPAGMSKRVPGSFDLDGSDVEDLGLEDDDEDWGEDDFGVPLRSPVRLATLHETLSRSLSQESAATVRERRPMGWDVD